MAAAPARPDRPLTSSLQMLSEMPTAYTRLCWMTRICCGAGGQ
jgi:hypothetical protein